MRIVGISGKRRSGKTLLADMLMREYGFVHLSLAGPLKEEVRRVFDLDHDHTDGILKEVLVERLGATPREIMIEYGKQKRSKDPLYWIKRLQQTILATPQAQLRNFVVSDIRFKNEAAWIQKHHGYLVRLERDQLYTGAPINDPSEMDLDDYDSFDLRIPSSCNVDVKNMEDTVEMVANMVLDRCPKL